MNFLNLEYFLAAAEELNFSRAAQKLYITQQSLSNHIAKLEKDFGLPLFDRTPPMTLTPAGQSLLENARRMLDMRDQAQREINDIRDFRNGDLTIGITRARGAVILPLVLPDFHKTFPHVRLHLFEGTGQAVDEALFKGKIDLSLGFKPCHPPVEIHSEILCKEHSVILVPKAVLEECFDHQTQAELLDNKWKKQPLTRFERCPFVSIHPSTWAGNIFYSCCRDQGVKPRITVETNNIMTMIALSLKGMGVAVCPALYITQANYPNLLDHAEIFLLDYEPSDEYTAVNFIKGKYQPQAVREFIRMAKERLGEG